MGNQKLIEEYLAKARQAQVLADSFPPDSFYRTSWLAIAEGYAALAEAERHCEPSSEKVSPSAA